MKTMFHVAAQCLCAVAISISGARAAAAQSVLSIHEQATGETSVYTAEDAQFSVVGDGQAMNISVGRNVKSAVAWYFRFEAPAGEVFKPGRYQDAGCPFTLRSGRAAGMEVTNNNPICRPVTGQDSIWGSFAIRQIAYGKAGDITSLEIFFEQRAGSPDAEPLTGLLRYRASPLSLTLASDPNFAWGGISQRYDGDTSFFALEGTTSGLHYIASVPHDRWVVAIEPPIGQTLRPGVYQTRNFADGLRVGLSIQRGFGPQRCISSGGRLEILEMEVGPAGEVLSLRATFDYRCEARVAALRGTIRYLR